MVPPIHVEFPNLGVIVPVNLDNASRCTISRAGDYTWRKPRYHVLLQVIRQANATQKQRDQAKQHGH